ncbi:MAG: hypothetical protein MJE66_07180 [Proteobacteria bacterium]|nr:hypothetical protein [Pseudomonadota bacterium]
MNLYLETMGLVATWPLRKLGFAPPRERTGPDRAELFRLRAEIEHFLKSDSNVLRFRVGDREVPPSVYYRRAMLGRRLKHFSTVLIIGFCTILPAGEFKNWLYRLAGMSVGRQASISIGTLFDFAFPELISIGDRAVVGQSVKIATHEITTQTVRIGRVEIGEMALIGSRAIVRCGYRIGPGAVVGAGAVVTRDVQELEFVGGAPLRHLKQLSEPL